MAKCSLGDWQIEGLRLSTFVIDTIDPANRKFWESLIGTSPDEVHSRPRQPSVKEEGPFLNGWLSVEASNNRIDWRLSHDPKNPPQELPAVGPYDVLRGEFQELMKRWLTLCPPIHRLAYGAVLLLPIRSLPDAHTMLDNLLPAVKIDRDNTRDLLYRINMRRASFCSIEGLEINRLSTWSVVRISEMLIDIPPGGQQSPKFTPLIRSKNVCRLELDINTAPEFPQELDKSVVSALFDELVELGSEIAAEGAIP